MGRASTTLDIFNAVAEPKRRAVLNLLHGKKLSVNAIADGLSWPQPQVSKHLSVLKQVGAVNMERNGRQKLYSINAEELKPIFDWAQTFESLWNDQSANPASPRRSVPEKASKFNPNASREREIAAETATSVL